MKYCSVCGVPFIEGEIQWEERTEYGNAVIVCEDCVTDPYAVPIEED